jgi:hypothetical protein
VLSLKINEWMRMGQVLKQQNPAFVSANGPENPAPLYAVYVYHPSARQVSGNDWELKFTTPERSQALKYAAQLQTCDYERIEIKKRHFRPKTGRSLDLTIKTMAGCPYKHRQNVRRKIIVGTACGVAAILFIVALGFLRRLMF